SNPEFLRSLGLVQETAGKLDAAIESYVRSIQASASTSNPPSPELLLRVARLQRWTARPGTAVQWYERYLDLVSDASLRRAAQAELAISLYESGDPAAAAARVAALE